MNKGARETPVALIVGAGGFVGGYLAEYLAVSGGCKVYATKLSSENAGIPLAETRDLNILDRAAIAALLEEVRPDYIFHLAAQSSVAVSWKRPDLTVDVNIKGTLNLLEAVRESGLSPRLLLIGSSEEYGYLRPEDIPVGEETLPRPGNIYAVTKNAQNQLGRLYAQAYGLDVLSTRSFNHIGPNQAPIFVVADFCKQVAEIEAGQREAVLRVGNLSAQRDFTDVRDVVRAYGLLAEKGAPGETYNVGQGRAVSIQEILDRLLELSSSSIEVVTDPAKLRPIDVPIIQADISKLQAVTGWAPKIPLSQTLEDTLAYWRDQV